MAEQTPETLHHFAVLSFGEDHWRAPAAERHARLREWLDASAAVADVRHLYQLHGLEGRADLLVWSACRSAAADRVAAFFADWTASFRGIRPFAEARETLWGFTRPSPYTKTRSTQELDPFEGERRPWLVAYPFVKTSAWYQLDREARQQMMAGHIRAGTQYKEITQLLLYSFGVQDQEFVVVYEMDDPRRFSRLVQDLRETEARPYTERDAPLHAGLLQRDFADLSRWL